MRFVQDNHSSKFPGTIGVSAPVSRDTHKGKTTLSSGEALRFQLQNLFNNTPGMNRRVDVDREQYEEFRIDHGL